MNLRLLLHAPPPRSAKSISVEEKHAAVFVEVGSQN